MNLKKVSLLVIGISSFVSMMSFSHKESIKVNADEELYKTIYIDVSNDINLINKDIAIHYVNEIEKDIPLTHIKDNIYQGVLPYDVLNNETYGFDIFFEEYHTPKITNTNLQYDAFNYLVLNEVNEYGCYSSNYYDDEDTYDNQRVWLYIDGNNQYENVVSYVLDSEIGLAKSHEEFIGDSRYYFFDIPYQISSLTFLKMDGNIIKHFNQIELLQYGVCYVGDPTFNEVSPAVVKGANAHILGRVVEAYLTYGKDPSNGCKKDTVRNIFETWFSSKSASKSQLKEEKIMDYTGYAANGNSYIGLKKDAYFSVNEKWNTMCSQAGIDPSTGKDRSMFFNLGSDTKGIVIIGGLISIIVIGGFIYLVRKKRVRNREY